jgi:hypothetical protein
MISARFVARGTHFISRGGLGRAETNGHTISLDMSVFTIESKIPPVDFKDPKDSEELLLLPQRPEPSRTIAPNGKFRTATIQLRLKDENDNWQTGTSYGANGPENLERVARQARENIKAAKPRRSPRPK